MKDNDQPQVYSIGGSIEPGERKVWRCPSCAASGIAHHDGERINVSPVRHVLGCAWLTAAIRKAHA